MKDFKILRVQSYNISNDERTPKINGTHSDRIKVSNIVERYLYFITLSTKTMTNYSIKELRHVMRKPVYAICEHERR